LMHGLKSIEDMCLRPPQRRKAQTRELRLQLANIVPAERHVVSQISGAGAIGLMKRERALQERRLELDHIAAERGDLVGKLLQRDSVKLGHGRRAGRPLLEG
jgi:hypothetical protein